MKRVVYQITESYTYDSYDEFVNHYNEMIAKGFRPNSEASRPDYWKGDEMEIYFATYYIEESNY